MMNPKSIVFSTFLLTSLLCTPGCGGDEEPVEVKPFVLDQPKASPPKKKSLEEIRNAVNADERIIWKDEDASQSNTEREGIFRFFTAFLQNDHETLRPMLSLSDQLELNTLTDSMELVTVLDSISRVDIFTGSDPISGDSVVLAIYEVGMEYQPQFWSFEEANGALEFSSLDSPPNLVGQLSGDWIKEYFKGRAEFHSKAGDDDEASSYQLAGDDTAFSGENAPAAPGGIPQMPGSPRPKNPGDPGPGNPGRGPMTP